jgi:ArsR family transcriptional regulator
VRIRITSDLDGLIKILENPIRRKIVECLSQEPSYSLRISKQLGLGQQLVTKHLNIMERSGFVNSSSENSPLGAQRKVFGLAKSFSIIIDVAPNLFRQNMISFDVTSEEYQISRTVASIMERRDEIIQYPIKKDKMKPFSKILTEIDSKLEVLELERAVLLSIRNSIMMEASKIIQKIDDSDSRRVFHLAFGEHYKSVETIAKSLNFREDRVKKIIQKMKNELNTEYFQ